MRASERADPVAQSVALTQSAMVMDAVQHQQQPSEPSSAQPAGGNASTSQQGTRPQEGLVSVEPAVKRAEGTEAVAQTSPIKDPYVIATRRDEAAERAQLWRKMSLYTTQLEAEDKGAACVRVDPMQVLFLVLLLTTSCSQFYWKNSHPCRVPLFALAPWHWGTRARAAPSTAAAPFAVRRCRVTSAFR